ncbi:MAG TPA: 3',5'-cyclic-nucleotide phosphodiesterase [Gallionellaceae bacterium]|nr:3',5'-cyclic-nucleotide phosphodiesterase [Gallionellaceae bacterium]
MKLKVLGCSGGIGGNLHTTSLLLDHDVLIDAGTGVVGMSLEEMSRIDHIFVTHSHLDHIACIPMLVDSVSYLRAQPVIVHALPETIEILQQHIFNWKIWPDFTQIPNPQQPYMRFEPIALGQTVTLGGRSITPLPSNHVVPAVGFQLDSGRASLAFTGDTSTNDAFWQEVNRIDNLRYVIIETAFANAEVDLAVLSKHMCPSLLGQDLLKLKRDAEVYITHLKPGEVELTMCEVREAVRGKSPHMLQNGQVFEF